MPKGKKSANIFNLGDLKEGVLSLKKDLIKKGEAEEIFGVERENSFGGIVNTVFQTFSGNELYPTIESKASHLLYFIIKDHPFVDGNKRIGAFTFIYFLQSQKYLFRKNGEKKINDTALTALALLVAESKPDDKDQIINLISNIIF